jgi:hypothetical protein
MEHQPHSDWDLIQGLGGPSKVASLLGITIQRVQNWKLRGIPSVMKLNHPHLFLRVERQREKTPA